MSATVIQQDARIVGAQVEVLLQEWGVKFEYVAEFPIKDIRDDLPATQVRVEEELADPRTVAEFVTQVKAGAVFPPLVLWDNGGQSKSLTDGNTRKAAYRQLKWQLAPAFVCKFPTAEAARMFAGVLNQRGGRRLGEASAQRIALDMIERGISDEAISRDIGRSTERVRQIKRGEEFKQRAEKLGLTGRAAGLKPQAKVKLAQIGHDPVFAKAVEVTADAQLGAKAIGDLLKVASGAASDQDAIHALDKAQEEMRASGPPPNGKVLRVSQDLSTARRVLGQVGRLSADKAVGYVEQDDERRVPAIEKWRAAHELTGAVLHAYGV